MYVLESLYISICPPRIHSIHTYYTVKMNSFNKAAAKIIVPAG